MSRTKKMFAFFLAFCLLLGLMPARQVFAETVYTVDMEWECQLSERDSHDSAITSMPGVADGNHELWIDRIADLPDFARKFYVWLENNATATGALADPSLGSDYNGRKVYLLETVTGSVPFTYSQGDSLSSLALTAAQNDIGSLPTYIANYAFATYGAFDRDNPQVFWLSGSSKCGSSLSYSYSNASGGMAIANYTLKVYFYLTTDTFDLRLEDHRDTATIAAAIDQREADIDRILEDFPTTSSIYDQILYLNDALTKTNAYNSAVFNGDYDSAAATAWECVSALSGLSGATGPVCEGYARAFKLLCDRVGIPCVLVEGYANGGSHMWNSVKMGSQWYGVDVTWNDPVVTSNLEGKVSGYEGSDWLGLGSNTVTANGIAFSEDHVVENVTTNGGNDYCNGPVLAAEAYEPASNYMDIAAYRSSDGYTAPEKSGYVFAGWFADTELTVPVSRDQTAGWAYAKFVDSDTLTLKFQTTYGTSAESASTDLRLLTSVDSLQLSAVYFDVTVGGATRRISSSTVYEQINAGGTLISAPSAVFGADSVYFVTYTLLGVPRALFETDITAVPGWETLDGTPVTGTARTFQIIETY